MQTKKNNNKEYKRHVYNEHLSDAIICLGNNNQIKPINLRVTCFDNHIQIKPCI